MENETSGVDSDLAVTVKRVLDAEPSLRSMLFPFGFLILPEEELLDLHQFPFYGLWKRRVAGRFQFVTHPDQTLHMVEGDDHILFLLGHAYDPIALICEEAEILNALKVALDHGDNEFLRAFSRVTGVFSLGVISGETITVYGDATGMQTIFYGHGSGSPFFVSHAALAASLFGFQRSDYVRRLTSSKFYQLFGRALPGDLAPYPEMTRLVPNFQVTLIARQFTIERFYLLDPMLPCSSEEEFDEVVSRSAEILRQSMRLVSKKWSMPAISLTGGCDSQTTLASAIGNYDRLRYFSYISSPEEQVDAEAAQALARQLGLHHELILIPSASEASKDVRTIASILELNYGNIGVPKSSEVAKRMVLRKSDIDVEIKSWVSEVARCYYHKRFLKRRFPRRPTARYLTTLFKVFAGDRKLVRMTDKIFDEYLKRYCSDGIFDRVDWWDVIFWEFRVASWNGLVVTGDHRFSFEIDIPYNNRMLLSLLLRASVADRIADRPHAHIRQLNNIEVEGAGILVTNVKHTSMRARLERAYLEIHSRWPL